MHRQTVFLNAVIQMNIERKKILFNLQFWLIYFLYEWIGNAAIANEYHRYLINAVVIVPITFAATMFTVHILIRKFFLKGRKDLFWIGLILSMVFFILVRRAFNYYYTYPLYYPDGNKTTSYLFLPKLIIEGVSVYLIAGLYTMFYFVQAWYEQQRLTQALQKDKVEAQLELLKSQVQPHFIFNTLNNLYALALRKDEKIPDLLYRLSSFLSYSLYDGKLKTIPVSKELEYINHYIELEKIRHDERLDVSVNVYSPLEGFMIGPLLLLPLVENCYKHGISNSIHESWIRIDLSIQNDWLTVKIENSRSGNHISDQLSKKNGIGLENVKRRLEILYPGQHEFKCLTEEHSYLTILRIKNCNVENTVPYRG